MKYVELKPCCLRCRKDIDTPAEAIFSDRDRGLIHREPCIPAADCACCGMNLYRTADGGCTYCAGSKQICCRS